MEGFRLEQFWFTLLHSSDSRELWHPELEVIFLLQGTGRVYFPDLKTAYTLRQRDIFAVNGFEVLDFELDEGAAALSAIQNLYLLTPLPFMIAMPVLYYFYKLDKIYPQVMAELEQREKEGKL